MFKIENDNQKIGRYLSTLIDQNFDSKRKFCKAYLAAAHEEVNDDNTGRMANRLSQIIKGKKAIQTYDLPYFTDLLGVSCEQILSAGEYCPKIERFTNYSIAQSKDPSIWQAYIDYEDKLILNQDEYNKTVIDYALAFGNYAFLKYLMDKKYIWFDGHDESQYIQTFGAGTSIQKRDVSGIDWGLKGKLMQEDKLRTDLIAIAADHNDLGMLEELRARENPRLYFDPNHTYRYDEHFPDLHECYDEKMIKHIASSSEIVLDYFTDPFETQDKINYKDGIKRSYMFMFPYLSELLDQLIMQKSNFAETALKKALKHNKVVYEKLCQFITAEKNDERYIPEYLKKDDTSWIKDYENVLKSYKDKYIDTCKDALYFDENTNMTGFHPFRTYQHKGFATNIAHVSKTPTTPILKHLAEELNDSYHVIRDLKDHVEEVAK